MEIIEFIERVFKGAKAVGLIDADGRDKFVADVTSTEGAKVMGVFLDVLNEVMNEHDVSILEKEKENITTKSEED